MGEHKTKTCNVCCKTMTSNNLRRHIKRHEIKPQTIERIGTGIDTHMSGTWSGNVHILILRS